MKTLTISICDKLYDAIVQDAHINMRPIRSQIAFELMAHYEIKPDTQAEEIEQKPNNTQYLHNCRYAKCTNKLTDVQYKKTKGLCPQHTDKQPSYEVI